MRHVSRTHRVALDWLFDRINLDPKIQIWYIDTKHQLADILTKGNFTRDECHNLLHLFNIIHFSSTCCAQNFSLTGCKNKKEEDKIVAKSKPTAMNLTSNCLDKFLIREPPDCVEKAQGYSKHLQVNLTRGQEEIQNPTQRRVLKEGWKMQTLAVWWLKWRRNLPRQIKVRNHGNFSESESWSNHEKEVTGKLVASGSSRNSGNSGNFQSWKQKMAT